MRLNIFARQNGFVGLAIIAVMTAALLSGCGTTAVTRSTVTERPDSIVIKHDTVWIHAAHSDSSVVLHSSKDITAALSIRAKLDTTTASGVSLSAEYLWPEDEWNVNIKEPDIKVKWMVRDSLIEKPYPVEKVPLWVYLALGGMLIALVAVIIKK
jgi:hypothetical protein